MPDLQCFERKGCLRGNRGDIERLSGLPPTGEATSPRLQTAFQEFLDQHGIPSAEVLAGRQHLTLVTTRSPTEPKRTAPFGVYWSASAGR